MKTQLRFALGSALICDARHRVSTGSGSDRVRCDNKIELTEKLTRSLPLPVLTSSVKLGHYLALGSLLVLVFLFPSVGSAQQSNPPGVSFTVRLKDGKTTFKQGELITIEMLFASSLPDTYRLDARTYDRIGHLEADTYHVEPEVGATEPLFDYLQSGMFGGSMGGIAPMPPLLQAKPYIIAQALNEFVRFDGPGKYRLYVSNSRIGRVDPNNSNRVTEEFRATSNTIEIEILPADPDWQKQELQEAIAVIDGGKQMDRRSSCRALRFLNSEDAEAEMIRRYRGNPDGCDGEFHFGLLSSPRRDSVIDQMESMLTSPDHPITASFIHTLATLAYLAQFRTPMQPFPGQSDADKLTQWQAEIKRRRDAFQEIMAHYAEQISEVISRKEKSARAVSIETFLQFEANIPREKRTPARIARANQIAAAVPGIFLDLPSDKQYALLTYSWKQIAGPALLPILRQVIERPSSPQEGSFSDLRGFALYRMYELAPDEGRRAILKEIQRTPLRVKPQTLSILPDETLPELDQMLTEKLAQLDPDQRFQFVADYSLLIARYASSASLADVRAAVGDKIGKMACAFQAPLVAYFLRVDPRQGGLALEESLTARKRTRCFESELSEVANLFMSPEVRQAAIKHLNDPNMVVSMQSVAVLSQHGTVDDESLLWNRLQEWHDEWQGRNPELELKTKDEEDLPIRPAQIELELVRAIGRGQGWLMDSDKFKRLQQLCLTPTALREVSSIMSQSETREIGVSSSYPIGRHYFRVAQYEFRSFDDFREKLGQFPKGTAFTAPKNDDPVVERLFDKIEAFLSAGGMKLNRATP